VLVYVVMAMVRPDYMYLGYKTDKSIGLLGGKVIGLPPVLNFGSEELKAKVLPEVLDGKKFICLAISEAHAGSDVMGLQTTAVKTEDGKHWIING
jgi:alkylation response protein AidB-like acyl-CoA dehydrogenase